MLSSEKTLSFSVRQLAEKILELYWPHTAEFNGQNGGRILSQNSGGQAEIVSAIRRFRDRYAGDPSEPLSAARARSPQRFENLLRTVEWKLIEMPLPRLQVIGNRQTAFLYRVGWDRQVRRQDIERQHFDGRIHLVPGVAERLVQLSGLLRPLIQREWAGMVARLNRDATDEARLQEFLFGAARISTDPVRNALREMQDNRCFYCHHRLCGAAQVDHFIPWARYPDNGIENLVVADERCNNSKRDFLAAGEHVARWRERFSDAGTPISAQLADIAHRTSWDRHPGRTVRVARTIYFRLPDDVQLWLRRAQFTAAGNDRARLLRALTPDLTLE